MNKIVKLALVLFLVCAIVAGVLGVVNLVTEDKIAEQDRIKTQKAYAAVLEADDYQDVDFDAEAFRPSTRSPRRATRAMSSPPPSPALRAASRWLSASIPT